MPATWGVLPDFRGGRLNVIFFELGVVLLILDFMTVAWYAHLWELHTKPWFVAAPALFEYMLQVPANRIGYTLFTIPQLKIMQEIITPSVFVPVAIFDLEETKLDYVWAALCLCGAGLLHVPRHGDHFMSTAVRLTESLKLTGSPRESNAAVRTGIVVQLRRCWTGLQLKSER